MTQQNTEDAWPEPVELGVETTYVRVEPGTAPPEEKRPERLRNFHFK